jgi:hypothetical protein
VLDLLLPEPGAFCVMDRGYLDSERLHRLHVAQSFFVTRAKSNLRAERRYSRPVDRNTGARLRPDRRALELLFSSGIPGTATASEVTAIPTAASVWSS